MHSFGKLSFSFILSIIFTATFPFSALADSLHPWQIGLQDAASPVMEEINHFHNILLIIISIITAFVTFLLAYVCIRFSAKRNPEPNKFSHNTKLEIIWSAIPALILICIAYPSLQLMNKADKAVDAEMTLKVVGYQFYWEYEYPDNGGISFASTLIEEADLKPGQKRLAEVDNKLVLPINTNIRILVTSDPIGVIHSWAVPAFGIKTDAVPGRLNETWVRITKPGIYRGQCSELCGTRHGYMPIIVEAVSKDEFDMWIRNKKPLAANEQRKKIASIHGQYK